MRARLGTGLLCCAILLLGMTATAIEANGNGDALPYELIEVSPSVTVARHDNGSNISCVALDDGLVFFDASLSTATAAHFRREMEVRFERPTIALVLTHAHLDHILGMGAFGDVPVYAAAAGRPRWEHFMAIEWDERSIAGYGSIFPTLPQEIETATLRLPTDWFADELVLGSAEDELVIRRTGGHTADSSSAMVESDDVVIAGDLVQAHRRPYFGEPDTDFSAWIGTLEGWEQLEVKAVCPGHGPVIEVDELAAIRVWFEQVSSAMVELKSRGVSFEKALSDPGLPPGYWPDEESVPRWWATCIKRLYDAS